jgi:hypothetical protein
MRVSRDWMQLWDAGAERGMDGVLVRAAGRSWSTQAAVINLADWIHGLIAAD